MMRPMKTRMATCTRLIVVTMVVTMMVMRMMPNAVSVFAIWLGWKGDKDAYDKELALNTSTLEAPCVRQTQQYLKHYKITEKRKK